MTKNEQETYKLLKVVMEQESIGHKGRIKSISWAQTYAKRAIEDDMKGEMLRVQILYVLSNLSSWRGLVARQTKAKLNKLVKIL